MARIAYVNGRYRPIAQAAVSIEDRGYQFADGVYEVIKIVAGGGCFLDRHLDRLARSLAALAIVMPVSRAALLGILGETLRRNGLRNALVYIQVTRGTAPRNHVYPRATRPSLVVTVRRAHPPSAREMEEGVGVVTLPDLRWRRCDIKSVSLLPNVMVRQQAAEAGCREAWLYDAQGLVTEGSSSNAWIVDAQGRLITRPLGTEILGGITRSVVLDLARAEGIEVVERAFSVEEARAAREAFLTSTSSPLLPVTVIDSQTVANGHPGSLTRLLLTRYRERLIAAVHHFA